VDCSPEAGLILSKAAELARYSDGTVTVLHVLHGESSESVRRLQAKAALKLADIPYEWLTTPGEIAQTIIETALRLKADPIVIGKAHPVGLKSMGSVSELILSQSPIPTVVITP
jgi:nucleotide-binding universal stress UspA family protein